MKKYILIFLSILFSSCLQAQNNLLTNGKAFLASFFAKDYKKALELFDESVLNQINETVLNDAEAGIVMSFGDYKEAISYKPDSSSAYKIVYYYCKFEKTNFDMKIVFSANSKIVGFYTSPHKTKKEEIYTPL